MARKKGSNAKKEVIFVCICIILVITAIAGGYVFSNKLAQSIVAGDESNENKAEALLELDTPDLIGDTEKEAGGEPATEKTGSEAIVPVPIDMHPVNVAFLHDESKKITGIRLEVLDCVKMEMLELSFPGNISYTMSSVLYKELTAANVTLPQTVSFSELYHYYGDSRAYDAGRQIIAEMLSIKVAYYTGICEKDYYDSYVDDSEEELAVGLEDMVNASVTNWDYALRSKYLPVYNSLRITDYHYEAAPVQVKNESTIPDISGVTSIILQSGVELWESEE